MGRKIMAKVYDLVIFIVIIYGTYMPADGYIYTQGLPKYSYAILILCEGIIFYILFALIPNKTHATIGQSLEKLVMKSTKGHITVFRLFMKGIVSFIAYIPITIIVIMTLIRQSMASVVNPAILVDDLYWIIAILFVLVDIIMNLYLYKKFSQSFSDRLFDIKVTLKKRKTINFKDFKDIPSNKEKNVTKEILSKKEKEE